MVYIKNFVDNIWSSHPRRNITHYNLLVRLSLEGQSFDFCKSTEESKGEQLQRFSGNLLKNLFEHGSNDKSFVTKFPFVYQNVSWLEIWRIYVLLSTRIRLFLYIFKFLLFASCHQTYFMIIHNTNESLNRIMENNYVIAFRMSYKWLRKKAALKINSSTWHRSRCCLMKMIIK